MNTQRFLNAEKEII